jgi:hypothetical protein
MSSCDPNSSNSLFTQQSAYVPSIVCSLVSTRNALRQPRRVVLLQRANPQRNALRARADHLNPRQVYHPDCRREGADLLERLAGTDGENFAARCVSGRNAGGSVLEDEDVGGGEVLEAELAKLCEGRWRIRRLFTLGKTDEKAGEKREGRKGQKKNDREGRETDRPFP